jgi:hypothetical protein
MRLALAAFAAASALALLRSCGATAPPPRADAPSAPPAVASSPSAAGPAGEPGAVPVLFARDVRPVLERRCSPCHFAGGKMHDELPFDDPATVHRLGERLFSRIREPGEVEALRRFLAAQASGSQGRSIGSS